MIDYSLISRQIIRALRGDLSQQQINNALNKDFNLAAKLETGNRNIDWQTFCEICEFKKIPLTRILEYNIFYNESPTDENKLFNFLCSKKEIKNLAQDLSMSESQIRRKKNGDKIYLQDILELIHIYFPVRFTNFMEELNLDDRFTKEIKEAFASYEKNFKNFLWEDLFLVYLDSDEYKKLKHHNDKIIAEKIGIEEIELRDGITSFIKNKLIDFNGTHYFNEIGSYTLTNEYSILQKKYTLLLTKLLEKSKLETEDLKSYKRWCIFSVNQATIKRLNKLTDEYYAEFLRMISKEEEKEKGSLYTIILNIFKPLD